MIHEPHGRHIMVKRREQRKQEAAKDHVEQERPETWIEQSRPGIAVALFAGLLTAVGYFGVMLITVNATSGNLVSEQLTAKEERQKTEIKVDSHIESADIRFRRVENEQAREQGRRQNKSARIK